MHRNHSLPGRNRIDPIRHACGGPLRRRRTFAPESYRETAPWKSGARGSYGKPSPGFPTASTVPWIPPGLILPPRRRLLLLNPKSRRRQRSRYRARALRQFANFSKTLSEETSSVTTRWQPPRPSRPSTDGRWRSGTNHGSEFGTHSTPLLKRDPQARSEEHYRRPHRRDPERRPPIAGRPFGL